MNSVIPQLSSDHVRAMRDMFTIVWSKYNILLKNNLPKSSTSWAYTSGEWNAALLKTRDDMSLSVELSQALPWELMWRSYFHQYPHLINKGDAEHRITPLMVAVILKRADLVAVMLDVHADVDLQTEEGESAVSFAKHYKLDEIVELLASHSTPCVMITSGDM